MWASLMGGIRARLVSLVVLAFIPAVLLAMYFASSERAWIASHVRLQAVRAAEDAAETQARGIESTRTLLQGLIRFPEIRTLDPVRCGALLTRIKDVFPQYANLAVADGQGHVSCSAEPLKAALNIADSSFFQRVLQTKAFAVGDYTSGRIATRGILPLAYPWVRADGSVGAVLVAALDPQWLNQPGMRSFLLPGMTFTVFDRNGIIIVREPEPIPWVGKRAPPTIPVGSILAQSGPGTVQGVDERESPTLFSFAPVDDETTGHRLFAVVSIPVQAEFAEPTKIPRRTLIGFIGLALGIVLVGALAGERYVAAPVKTLVDATRRLGEGDLSVRMGLRTLPGEFGQLGRAFDEMAAQLEHKRAETDRMTRLLRGSEERYRRLSENALDIIYRYQVYPVRGFQYVSPAVTTITGYTPAEYYADPDLVLNLIHANDRHFVECMLNGDHPLGVPVRLRGIRKDGVEIWMEQRSVGFYEETGRLVAIEGIARDITSEMHARTALEESQRRLHALFENAEDAILLVSDEGSFIDINPAGCTALGYSRDEILRLHIWDLIPEELSEPARQQWDRLRAAGRDEGELPMRRKDGQVILTEFRAAADILPGLHLSIFRDITARKSIEERLRSSEERLSEALRIGRMGSWSWDLASARVTWSEELCRLTRWDRAACPKDYSAFRSLVHPEDRGRVDASVAKCLAGGTPFSCQYRLRLPDGTYIQVEERGQVSANGAGRPVRMTGTIQDVTEMQDMAEALRHSTEDLRSLSQRLVDIQEAERLNIARELHDEVGQISTGLKMVLQLAARHVAPEGDEHIRTAEGLLNDLAVRIRNLTLDLRPPMLDDLGLLAALQWHVTRYEEQTSIPVRFEAVPSLGHLPHAMEMACFRIVQEALTNVARHAGAKEAHVRVWVRDGTLHVQVEDDGRGFDQTVRRTGSRGGIIGMQERAQAVGGQVALSSAPGSGTIVHLELPMPDKGQVEAPDAHRGGGA